jgi:hypothetical protein
MDKGVNRTARFFVSAGRVLLTLAFVTLLGAWLAEFRDGSFAGLTQQHLFNDALALGILGVGGLLDGLLHSKGL